MSLHLEWQLGWAISDSVMVVLSDITTCANDSTSTAFPLFPYRQCPLGYWQVHRRGEACLWGLGNGSKWASWNLDYGTRFRECRIVFHGVDTNLSVEIFRFPRLASWRQVYNCRSLLCPLELCCRSNRYWFEGRVPRSLQMDKENDAQTCRC